MNRTDWVTDTKLFVSICIYDHSQNRREHFTLSSELFNHSAKVQSSINETFLGQVVEFKAFSP